jgi:RHS repeat-associated protein
MNQPGRKFSAGSGYRYGFNGQEKDKELNENITTAEYWEYESRIGRRWNIDPKPNEAVSPYNCFNGNPIIQADPKGDKPDDWIRKKNADGSYHYKFDRNVTKPENTPAGYEYVGPMTSYQAGNGDGVTLGWGGTWWTGGSTGNQWQDPPR